MAGAVGDEPGLAESGHRTDRVGDGGERPRAGGDARVPGDRRGILRQQRADGGLEDRRQRQRRDDLRHKLDRQQPGGDLYSNELGGTQRRHRANGRRRVGRIYAGGVVKFQHSR